MTIFKPTDNLESASHTEHREDYEVMSVVNYIESKIDIVLS